MCPKTQEQTLASNGVSRQKLVHIYREQNRATSVLPRNSLFYNPTPSQHSIKDQSLTATQKQVQVEKFFCVVLLVELWCLVWFRSRRVMFPLPRALSMQYPPVVRLLAILHLITNSRLFTTTFLKLYCSA